MYNLIWIIPGISAAAFALSKGYDFAVAFQVGLMAAAPFGLVVWFVRSNFSARSRVNAQFEKFRKAGFATRLQEIVMYGEAVAADPDNRKIIIIQENGKRGDIYDYSDISNVFLFEKSGKFPSTEIHITTRNLDKALYVLHCYGRSGHGLFARIQAAGVVG